MLDMGCRQYAFVPLQCFFKPFHILEGNIFIQLIHPSVNNKIPLRRHHRNIGNILPRLHDGIELGHNAPANFFRLFLWHLHKQIPLYIPALNNHRRDIFHIIDVGIDIPVHLAHQAGSIIRRILQNRLFRIIYGYQKKDSHRYDDQQRKQTKHCCFHTFKQR